jgi:hypothetical protein
MTARMHVRLIVESPGAADLVVAESEDPALWSDVLRRIIEADRTDDDDPEEGFRLDDAEIRR